MFTLAHASDLHVSGFGDTLHDRARLVRRSARVTDASDTRFATCWEEASWRVLRERHKKGEIVLVDPEGYSHPVPSARESGGLLDPVERAAAKACRLEARRAATLAAANPTEGALAAML
jgi:Icc protein